MSATTQELENDIAQLENRLADAKVVVEAERKAWRRSSHKGKRGTKWKGAVLPENESSSMAIPVEHWDVVELAQHFKMKQLGNYAQVVISEQITGKVLLETPTSKLRKLFEHVEHVATASCWKAFRKECGKLKQQQRRPDKVDTIDSVQPDSARSSREQKEQWPVSSTVMSSAGSSLVFPLLVPRASSIPTQNLQKLRKPASSHNAPMATCWNCKARFVRSDIKRSVKMSQPVSSSMRASLVARAYCSKACQRSIESGDIRISPSLSVHVKVTFAPSVSTEDEIWRSRSSRIDSNSAVLPSATSDPCNGTFVRQRSLRSDAAPDESKGFDFLHVSAPRREVAVPALASPPQNSTEKRQLIATAREIRGISRSYRQIVASSARPVPPTLMLDNSALHRPKQSKAYQNSKYKLDVVHPATFSSCFGALPLSNRPESGTPRVVSYGRGNFLRLQDFIAVRALHRLSLTSRAWYDLITMPSAFSDALWGVHVLRIWRSSEKEEDFLQHINVLKKPERPRRMLQILTRQVARVVLENVKVLVNPESWQLATVMVSKEGTGIRSLHKMLAKSRAWPANGGDDGQPPADLYEQITVIYARGGEIVAICARHLIRPVDPMALLTDILQGLESGELYRVHCRRLRLFSQANPLPLDQRTLLPQWSRTAIEFFWVSSGTETVVVELPVWHQKILTKVQLALQQRLLSNDSVNIAIKTGHKQHATASILRSSAFGR